jgi:hypothetical protein
MKSVVMLVANAVAHVACLSGAGALRMASCEASDKVDVVYRKKLDEGLELVVIRGPNVSMSDVLRVAGNERLADVTAVFPIRAEIQSDGISLLPLGTRLVCETTLQGRLRGGFDVLDASVDRADLVLATAENGLIKLWKINPFGETRGTALRPGDWSALSAIRPLDRTKVSVKLGWTQHRLVEAVVEDLRGPKEKHRSRFVQVGKEEWEFERVRGAKTGNP